MGAVFSGVMGLIGGLVALALSIACPIGGLYWLWVSIQLGSFLMFVVGMIPPLWPVTCFVGLYGLVFGMPVWVFHWFA